MFRNRDGPSINPKTTHLIPEVNFNVCFVEFECIVLVHGCAIFFLMISPCLCGMKTKSNMVHNKNHVKLINSSVVWTLNRIRIFNWLNLAYRTISIQFSKLLSLRLGIYLQKNKIQHWNIIS
jgi:hypothetical protein